MPSERPCAALWWRPGMSVSLGPFWPSEGRRVGPAWPGGGLVRADRALALGHEKGPDPVPAARPFVNYSAR